MESNRLYLLQDKHGKVIHYGDLAKLDSEEFILFENQEINLIELMKYQGYLHLLESEIELLMTYEEAIKKYPELYI